MAIEENVYPEILADDDDLSFSPLLTQPTVDYFPHSFSQENSELRNHHLDSFDQNPLENLENSDESDKYIEYFQTIGPSLGQNLEELLSELTLNEIAQSLNSQFGKDSEEIEICQAIDAIALNQEENSLKESEEHEAKVEEKVSVYEPELRKTRKRKATPPAQIKSTAKV